MRQLDSSVHQHSHTCVESTSLSERDWMHLIDFWWHHIIQWHVKWLIVIDMSILIKCGLKHHYKAEFHRSILSDLLTCDKVSSLLICMKLEIFIDCHFFCHIAVVTSQLLVMKETGVPVENDSLTLSHWQISQMPQPRFEPGQLGEKASSQWQHSWSHSHQCRPKQPILHFTILSQNLHQLKSWCIISLIYISYSHFIGKLF